MFFDFFFLWIIDKLNQEREVGQIFQVNKTTVFTHHSFAPFSPEGSSPDKELTVYFLKLFSMWNLVLSHSFCEKYTFQIDL